VAGPRRPKEDLNRFLGVTVTQVSVVIGTAEEEGFQGLEGPPSHEHQIIQQELQSSC